MFGWLLLAAMAPGPVLAPPPGITPIDALEPDPATHHVEVLRVRRDFGHPSVDVVLDAWMPAEAARVDDVRLWWSDELDRYPFSAMTRQYVDLAFDRLGPAHWRVHVGNRRRRSSTLTFDVRLHEGRPAAFADVVLRGGRKVEGCRVHEATLHGRRLFGKLIGLGSMMVTCTDDDGRVHRAEMLRER